MTTFAIVFLGTAIAFVLLQSILIFQYNRVLKQTSGRVGSDHPTSVAMILCVRGFDPSLTNCLLALTQQDYSLKKLIIVGDHVTDPGMIAAKQFLEKQNSLEFQILINDQIHKSCSLKCSNLVYACQRLDDQIDVIALVDADSNPPQDWLQMMVSPFKDHEVAVTTGIRWFIPTGPLSGTLVRYIWNTAAIVQMVCYRIPWGGSLAIRTSYIRETELLEYWSNGFCEDTMLDTICNKDKKKIAIVADAIIPSDEQTELATCIPWISRQLLTTRLHHPKWPLVLGHGLLTGTLSFGSLLLAITCVVIQSHVAAMLFAGTYVLIQAGNALLLNWIESPIARKDRSLTTRIGLARFLLGIFLTQTCYCTAILKTVFARTVSWRQIDYQIGSHSVEPVGYQPYQQLEIDNKQSSSL